MSVEHLRWPFCRDYPLNSELKNPPLYLTVTDPLTGIQQEKEIYISVYSTSTEAQKEADELFAKILKVTLGIMSLAGMIALGIYLGRKIL